MSGGTQRWLHANGLLTLHVANPAACMQLGCPRHANLHLLAAEPFQQCQVQNPMQLRMAAVGTMPGKAVHCCCPCCGGVSIQSVGKRAFGRFRAHLFRRKGTNSAPVGSVRGGVCACTSDEGVRFMLIGCRLPSQGVAALHGICG